MSTWIAVASAANASFVTFETGQVRPLAMSPDGTKLFAVNTPDNRLEIFNIGTGDLTHVASVPVGLEPCAIAVRSNTEVWVVNHLSDSVSIVNVGATPPRVTRTLLVGDEPRDIVFANNRMFITTARRGQNSALHSTDAVNPSLTTQGTGRALVWAFDAANPGTNLEGNPLSVIALFGDTPRALAVAPGGGSVYAGVFHSGNRTTSIIETSVCNGGSGAGSCGSGPGGLPAPNTNFAGAPGPEVGLIVKFESGAFRDELGRSWPVPFTLPDFDVFQISTSTLLQTASFAGVGTVLFNMVTNPANGRVYVSNTEAVNEVRFEGPGDFVRENELKPPGEPASVIGHLHEARITVLNGATVTPRHLNKHIDYDVVPSPPGVAQNSLATPLGMAITSDGATLYVAAFGSSKVGVFSTTALENNTFVPSSADHITVTGGGPTGLVLDEARSQLYVFTRFDNSISVIDTVGETELAHVALYNPEPSNVVDGRPFLYDAAFTSSNGEASCSSCHVFGDMDDLAWDLGDPDGVVVNNTNPFEFGIANPFHPMKGPMTTQSLRGMADHGPMHWRGDRTGGGPVLALDESLAFNAFNPAFVGLIGRASQLTPTQMQAFTDFILEVTYPPNPIRALDNSLNPTQQGPGATLYDGDITDAVRNCNGCHALDPANGFFGGDGEASFEGETQEFKIPHLRNAYQKVGMFGNAGNQIRGFGFLHDGSVPTIFNFLSAGVFDLTNTEQRNLEAFIFAFPTTFAPIVGQQTTLTNTNGATVGGRIDTLIARAKACFALKGMPGVAECDLVVKGTLAGEARGWLGELQGACGPSQTLLFQGDRAADPPLTDALLRAVAATAGQDLTYTCAPPGTGLRTALDRDEDGFFDRDEIDAGSDPADPFDVPGGPITPTSTPTRTPTFTATWTASFTPTRTPTFTRTATFTATGTPVGTASATVTGTPVGTASATVTPTRTFTAAPTSTSSPVPSFTPTSTLSPTRTATATSTPGSASGCNSGILIDRAQLIVTRNLSPAGDERLKIKGRFVLTNFVPPIDPVSNGFTFEVVDTQSSQVVLSRFVPAGASPGGSATGWTANNSGTRWTFKDDTDSSDTAIRKVVLKDKSSRTPGLFSFVVRGKDGDFQVLSENLRLVVTLGGPAQQTANQCATRTYNNSLGAEPKCELKSGGNTLKCK